MSAGDFILQTRDVAAGYGGGDIISNISVDVEDGKIFTVIGPNGSGKSTFIKVLAGLLRPRVGGITIGNEHGDHRLTGFTLVTSSYRVGDLMGVIGVLGPTRMPYDKIIGLVQHTSRLVEGLLE